MYGTSLAANKNLIQTHLENMQMFFRKKKKIFVQTYANTHKRETYTCEVYGSSFVQKTNWCNIVRHTLERNPVLVKCVNHYLQNYQSSCDI